MGLLLPSALALSLLAIPIIIFYMLRLRRQPAKVSSLLLWQKVLQDYQANAPWQRLKRNLLLLLQLLLLALIVLALARPYFVVEAKVQGNVIMLLDASASMQATDVAPSRFDTAKSEAENIIRSLKPGDTVSLIAVSDLPIPLITADAGADRAELFSALNQLQATNVSANWETALALASAGAASQANSTVVILSDGAIPADLPAVSAPVQWIPIGAGNDNQAITALAAREGRNGTELFVQTENYSDEPAQTLLEINIDGQLFDARNLDLPAYPNGAQSLIIPNLPNSGVDIEARLTRADDLALDNTAATRRASLGGDVLLVGNGNLFLERAFSLLPGLSVFQASPDNLPTEQDFDLIIFDRNAPDTLPENSDSFLFIAPPQSTELFEVQGIFSNTQRTGLAADHPILSFTDFNNLHIAQAQKIVPPLWAETLLNSEGGPLLLAGETDDNQRVAILSFDLLKSDLPLQIEFPILIANLAEWLFNRPAAPPAETNSTPTNPLNAQESNIRPNQAQIYGTTVEQAITNGLLGQREFWWVLVALALPILFWEWWVYWRESG